MVTISRFSRTFMRLNGIVAGGAFLPFQIGKARQGADMGDHGVDAARAARQWCR
jgi:hypothetical protein